MRSNVERGSTPPQFCRITVRCMSSNVVHGSIPQHILPHSDASQSTTRLTVHKGLRPLPSVRH